MSDRTAGAPYFRLFARFAREGLSPLYERLTLRCADDPEMLALAALARPGQPQANILFAAVHFLLLAGAEHPLRSYYLSLGGTRLADESETYEVFRNFVWENKAQIEPLIRTRVTNTNETGRSALIYPALDMIARKLNGPMQIIEIGPSAGLNLNWHRFGYRYFDETGNLRIERQTRSKLVLETHLRGRNEPFVAATLPEVESNRGLELNPVDLSRPEERLWLRALIWPERIDRLRRLDAALGVAAEHPPHIVVGDASRDLQALLTTLPRGPAVIVHTIVLYQFAVDALNAFETTLAAASMTREIYRVAVEQDGTNCAIDLFHYDGSCTRRRRLAICDPHGGWLEWQDQG